MHLERYTIGNQSNIEKTNNVSMGGNGRDDSGDNCTNVRRRRCVHVTYRMKYHIYTFGFHSFEGKSY